MCEFFFLCSFFFHIAFSLSNWCVYMRCECDQVSGQTSENHTHSQPITNTCKQIRTHADLNTCFIFIFCVFIWWTRPIQFKWFLLTHTPATSAFAHRIGVWERGIRSFQENPYWIRLKCDDILPFILNCLLLFFFHLAYSACCWCLFAPLLYFHCLDNDWLWFGTDGLIFYHIQTNP